MTKPMSRLAGLGSILERPWLLAALAVFGLAAWGVVIFVAVRLAVISAAHANASRPRSAV